MNKEKIKEELLLSCLDYVYDGTFLFFDRFVNKEMEEFADNNYFDFWKIYNYFDKHMPYFNFKSESNIFLERKNYE